LRQPRRHEQVAQTAAGGWTRDQVITAIRNLEAPYEEVGGWQRAMQILGASQRLLILHRYLIRRTIH
jgi:hypothetical protein